MRKTGFICLLFAFLLPLWAKAQNAEQEERRHRLEVPQNIIAGLIAYRDKGPEECVKLWIKDSVLDGNKEALSQANVLQQAADFYGVYRNFEVLSTQDLSLNVRLVYLVINYDKGPLFGKFLAYRSVDHGWILLNFEFNRNPEAILPELAQQD